MRVEATRKLFTVAEYYRMADAGILTADDRMELIEGFRFPPGIPRCVSQCR